MTAIYLLPWLPSMLADGHTLFTGFGAFVPPAMLVIVSVALVLVVRRIDESTGRLWLAVGLVAELFDIWVLYHGATRYSLGWYLANLGGFLTSLVVLVAALHDITVLYRNAAAANDVLASQAMMDGLTGVANRRRLDETLPLEWRRAIRTRLPLSLIMIDVDFFKKFNDSYGHLAGDHCLQKVAGVLRTTIRRAGDFVARYGGEEFVVLLPATDALGAAEVADAIHSRLRGLAIAHGANPLGCVTVSCGIATALPHTDGAYEELLREADQNLYRAKQSGRNRTCGETGVGCAWGHVSTVIA
jgi:diguanylate cyclase (GGDEF)-like protein